MIFTFVRRAVALAAASALVLGLGHVAPASGSTSDDPDLVAVRFELVPTDLPGGDDPLSPAGSDEHSHYVEFQVDHGGVTRRLRPLAGPVTAEALVTAAATSVEIDGLRVGPAADGFDTTLGQVFGSAAVGSFVRIDTGGVGEPAVIQVDLGRSLDAGDYLLVQEAGGDAAIDIEAIGPDGAVVGAGQTVGPAYRWKSGHRTPDGSVQWASVIDASGWAAAGEVTGLRVRTAQAEVKVLVLEPAVGVIPLPLAETRAGTDAAATTDEPPTTRPSGQQPDPGPAPDSMPTPDRNQDPGPAPTPTPPGPATSAAPTTSPVQPEPVPEDLAPEPAPEPGADALARAEGAVPTALAMTGVSTDPWVLAMLATGLIFFGYTAVVAFRRPAVESDPDRTSGHAQLDALGFD